MRSLRKRIQLYLGLLKEGIQLSEGQEDDQRRVVGERIRK